MKSILIIGLGDFGRHLCRNLVKLKNEIMIIDKDETALEDLTDLVTSSMIADCTQRNVLQSLGVSSFDFCFVCIGSNFQSNLIITNTLKELGAKYVVSQTNDETLANFLLRNGADDIIHPNKDSAMRAAVKYNNDSIFDYIELKDGYSIYEITPIKEWIGKSILESDIRVKHDVYIIGIISPSGGIDIMPSPHTIIKSDNRLMVLANEKTIDRLLKRENKTFRDKS